jgi:FlaA1/EpsC-like NDP-sugar epimerase
LLKHFTEKEPVLIYGAGGAGVQLATALVGGGEYVPVGFVDDDRSLWRSTVGGLPVYCPEQLGDVVFDSEITHILLAVPSINNSKRRVILESLSEYPVHVKTIPSMHEIVSGESVDSLREVDLEDLLGRDAVPADPNLIASSIDNKVVLVSGAGGSIGSEICRQVLLNKPRVIVLYEMSEFSLYSIEKELKELCLSHNLSIPVYPVLGSVLDSGRVNSIFSRFSVDTVYHAAAYKHVPMVEHNIFEGVRNNALGTKVLAEGALAAGVERFVLISTDKAVRPTNVMGATKRLAELILQELARESDSTVFSIVRFGNVLGSSGSVVPLFRKQIREGGPVTVTHPEITRFFMTIPEAATLVIQAGSMAEGGDVFVLDMGEPVKIKELAKSMIQLMGFEVKAPGRESVDGIEIEFSGLRPGEKLYEELLIGGTVVETCHPKIMRAQEEQLGSEQLFDFLSSIESAINAGDSAQVRSILEQAVEGFRPASPVVDWLSGTSSYPDAVSVH